jgi:hypothetical protein
MHLLCVVAKVEDDAHLKHNGSICKRPIPGAPTVKKIAPVIPSSYSRKMNQMGNTQDTRIILVQARGALRLVGSSFFSVFVCSVTWVAVCSYVLKCRRWDLNRGPLPLLI